jgi:pimeloyl-ACP methyl ester carboxylesterase
MTRETSMPDGPEYWAGPITLERQGSFYVGGREVTARGAYDPASSLFPATSGQSFWIDQMYVQYQIPQNRRALPVVLVHGGGGTGRVYETTPDGREGYQTIFLRRGFPVYLIDAPRGGRSGFPSFSGEFGKLDDAQQIVPNRTGRPGDGHAWSRWRLDETYEHQAFPLRAMASFMKHVRPLVSDDPQIVSAALVELFDEIGPAILVTHSNSGLWGWLVGARSPNVKAIVSYEPGYVFAENDMPDPVKLHHGEMPAGAPVTAAEFAHLAGIPIQVVFGDNIPTEPVPDLPADGRRAQIVAGRMFADRLNRLGGRAEFQLLPDAGVRGNSHFMFSDLNNVQVADQLSAFLARHGLDGRIAP